MGQPKVRATRRAILTSIALLAFACDRRAPATQSSATAANPKVASLVPGATDVILGMGAGDHLVAVSDYDAATVDGRELPHVGAYVSTDWETLATLRPDVMIIQIDEQRLAPAFKERAAHLGIRLVNIRPTRLADAIDTFREVGAAINEPAKAEKLAETLNQQIAAVKARAAGKPPVRTLLTMDDRGTSLIGVGTYIDDLLQAAGGENAAASLGPGYPSADRETLLRLKPDVVIILKPRAGATYLDGAKTFWGGLPNVPAGLDGRVYLLNQPYVLLPGAQLGKVAADMQDCLFPVQAPGATRP